MAGNEDPVWSEQREAVQWRMWSVHGLSLNLLHHTGYLDPILILFFWYLCLGIIFKQICMVHKLGYGNWEELKAAFRTSPLFRFDWFVKSRTTQELARRCDTLIRLVEKENQEYDERERQARKEKKLAKVLCTFLPYLLSKCELSSTCTSHACCDPTFFVWFI